MACMPAGETRSGGVARSAGGSAALLPKRHSGPPMKLPNAKALLPTPTIATTVFVVVLITERVNRGQPFLKHFSSQGRRTVAGGYPGERIIQTCPRAIVGDSKRVKFGAYRCIAALIEVGGRVVGLVARASDRQRLEVIDSHDKTAGGGIAAGVGRCPGDGGLALLKNFVRQGSNATAGGRARKDVGQAHTGAIFHNRRVELPSDCGVGA